MPGTGTLFLLAFAVLVVAVLLVLLHLTRLGFLIRSTIPDRPRRRMFIASVSFVITFAGVRMLVSSIVHGQGPVPMGDGGRTAHSPPGWGILILLLVGYGWLLDLGRSHSPTLDLFQPADGCELRRGRGAHAGRVCAVAEPRPQMPTGRARGGQHRRGDPAGLLAAGAWGAPFFRGLHRMWTKRAVVGKEVGRGLTFPIRLVRLIRPRRGRQSPPRSVFVIARRLSFIDGVSSPDLEGPLVGNDAEALEALEVGQAGVDFAYDLAIMSDDTGVGHQVGPSIGLDAVLAGPVFERGEVGARSARR